MSLVSAAVGRCAGGVGRVSERARRAGGRPCGVGWGRRRFTFFDPRIRAQRRVLMKVPIPTTTDSLCVPSPYQFHSRRLLRLFSPPPSFISLNRRALTSSRRAAHRRRGTRAKTQQEGERERQRASDHQHRTLRAAIAVRRALGADRVELLLDEARAQLVVWQADFPRHAGARADALVRLEMDRE